jgi:hypothetical protein
VKDDVPPAHKIEGLLPPPAWQGVMWGTLPILSSVFAMFVILAIPERRRLAETVPFPTAAATEPMLREAK